MPTSRTRHMVTESDQIKKAIDDAALVWPELANERAELLRNLISQGAEIVAAKAKGKKKEREKAVKNLISIGTGLWPNNFLSQRKDEWPN